jgi:hypothetical protein
METGRAVFDKFLRGELLSRGPFVPLVRDLPARVDGKSFQTLISDPTLWANSLIKTTELFGFDGIVAGFDFSFLAEACGCPISWENDRALVHSPRQGELRDPITSPLMKNALEVAARVFQVCRTEKACVAAMTGPVTLASQLFGREEGPKRVAEVKPFIVKITESFCQVRPDVLIFMEGRPLALSEVTIAHRRIYNTLKNVLNYYNLPMGLYLQGYRPENLKSMASLNIDIYVLGPSNDGSSPSLTQVWELAKNATGVGVGLPVDHLDKAKEVIQEGRRLYRSQGAPSFFFTSFGPVTQDVNIATLHQVVNEIRQVSL